MRPSRTPTVPPAPRTTGDAHPDEPALAGPSGRLPAEDPPDAQPRHGPTTGATIKPAGGAT